MAYTKKVIVNRSLVEVFESIRNGIAEQLKRQYGLKKIVVPFTLSSQILAAERKGRKPKFMVRKIGNGEGILEIFY